MTNSVWTSLLITCLAVIGQQTAAGQVEPDQEQLVRDAMTEAFRTSDAASIAGQVAAAEARVRDNASRRPDERLSASVYIRPGVDAESVAVVLENNDLELAGGVFKVPGDQGTTMTVGFAADVPLQIEGDVRARLEHALALAGDRLLYAEQLADSPDYPGRVPLASRKVRIFKIELIGTGRSFAALADAPEVLVVLPHPGDELIRGYEATKSIFQPGH